MRRADAPEPDPSEGPDPGLPQPPGAAPPGPSHPADVRPGPSWGKRQHDAWLQRWIRSTEDLADLQYSHRMFDAVIDEIDGRDIRIGDRWLTDYASCNFLGLDLDEEVIESVPGYLARWGTHPSWPRMLGSPGLYEEIESRLTRLLGCEDSLALPTITHIHMSVLPVLAGGGTVFLDSHAHKTIYDGCTLAQARGAAVRCFAHGDADSLEALLAGRWRRPGVICVDGVNSMSGNPADIAALAALARRHDALLYVDDAQGFGVLGERSPGETCAYGLRGNGTVRHAGETYGNVIVVGGFSMAYSSSLAFIACPTAVKSVLKTGAAPYLYSGPSPVASLATALEGLRVNDLRGDRLRARLHRLTALVLHRVRALGIETSNSAGLPVIQLPLADPSAIAEVGDALFERGIYATMAVYPIVPRDQVGIRLQVTAAHTEQQIDQLASALGELSDRFRPHGTSTE